MNQDGYSDFVIGAPYYDTPELGRTDNGEAWFYLGGTTPTLDTRIIAAGANYDHNGWSVALDLGWAYTHVVWGIIVGAPDAHDPQGNLLGGTVTVWTYSP